MTDVKENLEREAFEEWYCSSISESIGLERYPNGCYCNPEAENMFSAWCAAKSHAEAAQAHADALNAICRGDVE